MESRLTYWISEIAVLYQTESSLIKKLHHPESLNKDFESVMIVTQEEQLTPLTQGERNIMLDYSTYLCSHGLCRSFYQMANIL